MCSSVCYQCSCVAFDPSYCSEVFYVCPITPSLSDRLFLSSLSIDVHNNIITPVLVETRNQFVFVCLTIETF